jgi:hypothetical protein
MLEKSWPHRKACYFSPRIEVRRTATLHTERWGHEAYGTASRAERDSKPPPPRTITQLLEIKWKKEFQKMKIHQPELESLFPGGLFLGRKTSNEPRKNDSDLGNSVA